MYVNKAVFTVALRHAIQTIETEQAEPLNLDQVTTVYDLCIHLNLDPVCVMGKHNVSLIEPDIPLVNMLDRRPDLLDELGRMLTIGG